MSFNCVFRLDRSGVITRVAGISAPGYSGDGGPAIYAQLSRPGGLALDGAGNLFIADIDNHRIRKVSADGMITTLAGNGVPGFSGDGGPAIDAQFYLPADLAVDGKGNVFVLDWGDTYGRASSPGVLAGNRVRRVSLDGMITTEQAMAYQGSQAMADLPPTHNCPVPAGSRQTCRQPVHRGYL